MGGFKSSTRKCHSQRFFAFDHHERSGDSKDIESTYRTQELQVLVNESIDVAK